MKKYFQTGFLLFILGFCLLSSCNEFFLEDIDDDTVEIFAPVDGTETEIVTPTFWWGKVNGAEGYRLQIVSPSFESAEALLRDTLVDGDKFEDTLFPGEFEWRVRAENSEFQTEWSYAKLTIVDSEDLTRQTVRLRKPLDGQFLNGSEVSFKWDTLSFADSYEIRIYEGNWEQTLVVDSLGIEDNIISLNLSDSKYTWGIMAINEQSESLFTYRSFVLDNTSPDVPTLSMPEDRASLMEETIDFGWESSDPKWEVVYDSLLVYEVVNNDELELYHSDRYNTKTASLDLEQGKEYLWKVKSIDRAGNESEYSESYTFTVN